MGTIKTLATLAVLAAIGVGLYAYVNSLPEPVPPPGAKEALIDMAGIDPSGMVEMEPGGFSIPPVEVESRLHSATTPPARAAAVSQKQPPSDFSAIPERSPARRQKRRPKAGNRKVDPLVQPSSASVAATELPPQPQPTHLSFDVAFRQARTMLDANDLAGALGILSQWYRHPTLNPEEQEELTLLLGQLAGTVIYSQQNFLEQAYTAQGGERLDDIARQLQVSPEIIAHINGLDPNAPLAAGQSLKVIRGPFQAEVRLAEREIILSLRGNYAGRYSIGLGQAARSSSGDYTVTVKSPARKHFGLHSTIAAGAPDNPLGKHWIGLAQQSVGRVSGSFGIHGTNDPEGVYGDSPEGFIRLAPQHAAELYDILTVGSQVIVR